MVAKNNITENSKLYLNGVPVRVKFNFGSIKNGDRPLVGLKYCEAVNKVLITSKRTVLDSESISCPAAKKIFGFANNEGSKMEACSKELVEKGIFKNSESALKALSSVPQMNRTPNSITLSLDEVKPDVYLFYLRPKEFMKFVQAYQRVQGEELRLELSSVMPVCGNCTVRPYLTKKICLSFGCNDSRDYGGIPEDKFVVGITQENIDMIFQSLLEMEDHSLKKKN